MITHPKFRNFTCAILAFAAIPATAPAGQAFDAASATALIEKHRDAIVEVHLVNHLSVRLIDGPAEIADAIAQTPDQDQELHTKGVMIDPSGLVAVPGLPLDPTMLVSEMTLPTPIGEIKLGLQSRLADVRILTADGGEFPADVVMRDRDTGLMLVKIREAGEKKHASLTPDAARPAPSAFTSVLCLGRMSAAFGNQATTTVVRTTLALATRHGLDPLTGADEDAIGCAVFDAKGDFLGITVIPVGGNSSTPSSQDLAIHLLPAAALHRFAKEHLR